MDTFKNITSAVNLELVRKSQIETNTCHRVLYSKVDISIMSFEVTPFCCPMFQKFPLQKSENKQVPAALSHIRNIDTSITSFQDTPFCCAVFKKFA